MFYDISKIWSRLSLSSACTEALLKLIIRIKTHGLNSTSSATAKAEISYRHDSRTNNHFFLCLFFSSTQQTITTV